MEELAPTAAITSRVLRKGLSLTQIYTQLVDVTNELTLEREENQRLKSQMDVILRELEQNAPMLQQRHQDYEVAMEDIATLTAKLDELLTENNNLQEKSDEADRLAQHQVKENQKLKTELADLARQVSHVLRNSSLSDLSYICNKLKELLKSILSNFIYTQSFFFYIISGMFLAQRSSGNSNW